MSETAQAASDVVTASALAVGNGAAWFSSEQVGMIATGCTILGMMAIGLVTRAIKEISRSRAEAWADRVRLEMQIQADQEKLNAGSLNGQIKTLQAAIDEGNRRSVDLQKRIEDANKKLHDAANERSVEALRHHEEIERLTRQLELATKQLEETNEELHAARAENRTLIKKIEDMQKQVAMNSQEIRTLTEQQRSDSTGHAASA